MRLELFLVIVGLLVALLGVVLVADALLADGAVVPVERRRRARPERNRWGELAFGAGVICIAAALLGGDGWRFTNLAIAFAIVLVVVGAGLNLKYVRGLAFGPVFARLHRRRATDARGEKLRIR
jgi:hypothetical protein